MERHVASTAIVLKHFLFSKLALIPFFGVEKFIHTLPYFFSLFIFEGITKVVNPLPESTRGVGGFNWWLRLQTSDEEAQEVRGRDWRGRGLEGKGGRCYFGKKLVHIQR